MATQTPETATRTSDEAPHQQDVDFLSIVEALADLDERAASIEREVLAREMAKHPERYMPQQFEQLAVLYRERSDRQTHHWSGHIEEATMFASRTLDQSRLEEVYLIFDRFSPRNRDWQTRDYIARIIVDERGGERLLELRHDGRFAAFERDAPDQSWHDVANDRVEEVAFEFFRESLRAVCEQQNRTDIERGQADTDALDKLIEAYYPERAGQ